MFNVITAIFSVTITILLGYLIIKLYNFQRSLPDFQQVFDDFGEGLGKVFSEGIQNPTVKRAMGVLGKKSGEVRADTALRNRAAKAVIGQTPALGMIAKQLGFSELEAVQLMNDPMFGPLIQKGIGMAQKALSKAGKGSFGGQGSGSGKVGYG